jgi:hypothetical protein
MLAGMKTQGWCRASLFTSRHGKVSIFYPPPMKSMQGIDIAFSKGIRGWPKTAKSTGICHLRGRLHVVFVSRKVLDPGETKGNLNEMYTLSNLGTSVAN